MNKANQASTGSSTLRSALRRTLTNPSLALAASAVPGIAYAGPEGASVVRGDVTVTTPDANTTAITQGSNRAVVNWSSFNVGGQELVQFLQPSTSSVILNRVVGGSASEIFGTIQA